MILEFENIDPESHDILSNLAVEKKITLLI